MTAAAADSLLGAARAAARRGPPPVHLWSPPDCGPIDIVIQRDGTWRHEGTPIGRAALVKLFASILRREGDDYYLVTPVEKMRIRVEDSPFIAVDLRREGEGREQRLIFTDNMGEETILGDPAALRVARGAEEGAITPYIDMRRGLEARVDRKSFYRMIDMAEIEERQEGRMLGVWSAGRFHALAPAPEAEG